MIARHEVLRTILPAEGGQPYQRVLELAELGWQLPVTPVAEDDLAETAARIAAEPFDLQARVPVRARLLAAGPGVHVLVLVMHHIATDGWSAGILARDLGAAYAARRRAGRRAGRRCRCSTPITRSGSGSCSATLTTRAACWRRQAAWWRDALAGIPAELALPADRPRPAVASHRGHAVPLAVPAEVHAGLAGLAREQGVTLFMVVQAALAVLLSRLGRGRISRSGPAVAGRTDEALDDLVGFFVNTLVLRTDVSGDPAFTDAAGAGAGVLAGRAGASGCAVRAAGGGAGAGPVAGPPPAVPGMLTVQNNAPAAAGAARAAGAPGCRPGPGRPGST